MRLVTGRTAAIATTLVIGATAVAGCGGKDYDNSTLAGTTAATPFPSVISTPTPPPATPTATPKPKKKAKATPTPTSTPTETATPAKTAKPKKAVTKLAVEADPTGQLKFTTTSLSVKAGKVEIDFDNQSPLPHNVAIRQGNGTPLVSTKTISGGKTTADVKLAPGTYTYYCTVPGHEQAGMKGTLTVQ